MMGREEYGIIAILALLMVGISIGLAKAYQSAPPAIIATFDYSYLLFSVFWSFVIFAERPDAFTITGMLMIAGAGLLVIRCGEGAGAPSGPGRFTGQVKWSRPRRPSTLE